MPEPSTTRLGLYRPLNNGSENVNVQTDLNQNWDKVDLAAGFQIVTSTTRPATPYAGKGISESDTAYRTYFSNGTAPASASWVEIPNSTGSFGANLNLALGKQINIGASASTAAHAIRLATATDSAISSRAVGDAASRILLRADGELSWGNGTAAADTNLYRSAADTLKTDDALIVTGDLTVSTTTWTAYTPTVGNAGTATWSQRLGWYKKIGKVVWFEIYLAASGVGSGTSNLSVTLPSTIYRDGGGAGTTRQAFFMNAASVVAGTNSSVSGTGSAVCLAGGTGAVVDQLRGPTDIPMRGEQIGASTIITIQGWYREA
ncbi:hypothetical protein [Streptomyces sp. NPDC002994]|uniref:hypothetical protein n=1 Tax=Streptomyces sp. NPDC002994 TaxID=3154441 RepID=UPI0033A6CA3F